jgi:L-aminopeptidase/D-esterase-like protein
LRIAGVPVGQELDRPTKVASSASPPEERGSIIIVVATDAPLLPNQTKRLARRASLGLARLGSTSGNGSGDIFLAFSTANPNAAKPTGGLATLSMLPNDALGPIFEATVQAVEEAIVNVLVAAQDMTGVDGHRVTALPHDALQQVLRNYNRLAGGR